jgi:hypothetical protein
MNHTPRIELAGLDTHALVGAFRYITLLIVAFWDAHLDGRMSRYVAPPEDVESTIILMTEDIWRAVGTAIRSGSDTACIVSSLEPERMILALDTASRLLAFAPFARESGVDVPDDRQAHTLLVYMIEELTARAGAQLRNSTPDTGRQGSA